jgi:sigma-E factor negative regulatory protein RseA
MNESNAVRQAETDLDDGLSALMDGEWPAEAGRDVLARLIKDAEAPGRWAEYALIGDALRGQAMESARFMSGFRAQLAEEPTVLAPMPARTNLTLPVLWLAAAATVAGIAWTVLNASPEAAPPVPIAATPANAAPQLAAEVVPYLAAHQDYAHAVLSTPEMNITQVSMSEVSR